MGESLGYTAAMFLVFVILGVLVGAFATRNKILVGCTTIFAVLAFYESIQDGAPINSVMGIIFILPLIISFVKPAEKPPENKKSSSEIVQIKNEIKSDSKHAAIFLTVGAVLCIIAMVMNGNYKTNVEGNLVRVSGRIVSISDSWNSSTSTTDYIYRVEYEYEGKTYRTSVSGNAQGRVGGSYSLKIDPENPGKGDYTATGTVFLWIGLFALLGGVIKLFGVINKKSEIGSFKLDKETLIGIWNKLRGRSEED